MTAAGFDVPPGFGDHDRRVPRVRRRTSGLDGESRDVAAGCDADDLEAVEAASAADRAS